VAEHQRHREEGGKENSKAAPSGPENAAHRAFGSRALCRHDSTRRSGKGAVLLRPPLPKPLFPTKRAGRVPWMAGGAVDVEVSVEPGVIVTTPGVEQGTGQSPRILGFEKGKRPYRRCPFCN